MKRIALLIASVAAGFAANAQLSLSGSSYTQNFDNIGNGLPAGWEVDSAATPTSKGVVMAFDTTKTAWAVTTGKFKNFAAKASFTVNNIPVATQAAATDRALGLRQVGALDSMVAFELQINNTAGLTNFNLAFDLMSLDSTSPRTTTWGVDYGLGANPTTFTAVTPTGTMTTGGNTFASNHITVSFGSALNNQAAPVWIRIVVPHKTTGSGNRSSVGLDNFSLTWTGTAGPNFRPLVTAKNPANGATGVLPTTNLAVTFDRNISKGTGNIYLKNRTTQQTSTFNVTGSNVTVAGTVATITTGFLLDSATTYHVTFDSTAFDTAGYKSYGVYDTAAWAFTTIPHATPVVTISSLSENFDTACAHSVMPTGWSKYSVTGAQQWGCYSYGYNNTQCYSMNGYQGGNNVNEDWLITPRMNLSAMNAAYINFLAYRKFSGDVLKVMVSTDYSGNGNPNTGANWTDLAINFNTADTNFRAFSANLTAYKAQPMFVAFKYTSSATDGSQWKLDNIVVSASPTAVANIAKNNMDLTVVGNPTSGNIQLMFEVKEAGAYTVSVLDITGREMVRRNAALGTGVQRLSVDGMSLSSGMYIVKMTNENSFGATKAVVQ